MLCAFIVSSQDTIKDGQSASRTTRRQFSRSRLSGEKVSAHRVAGDWGMRFLLTQPQLEGLKTHVYRSQGISLIESLVLKRFWRWLVSFLPLTVAPNVITFSGFLIAMATSLAVIFPDLNAEGKVRKGEEQFDNLLPFPLPLTGSAVGLHLLCCWALHLPDLGWNGRYSSPQDRAIHPSWRVL